MSTEHLHADEKGIHLACPECQQANRIPFARLHLKGKCGSCKAALPLPALPVEIDSPATYAALVRGASLPLLVDFWAPWCGPCRMIGPVIEELSVENSGSFKVGKVNVDENNGLAMTYNVASIPTIMIFSGGQLVQQLMGVQPKARLQQALDEAKTA